MPRQANSNRWPLGRVSMILTTEPGAKANGTCTWGGGGGRKSMPKYPPALNLPEFCQNSVRISSELFTLDFIFTGGGAPLIRLWSHESSSFLICFSPLVPLYMHNHLNIIIHLYTTHYFILQQIIYIYFVIKSNVYVVFYFIMLHYDTPVWMKFIRYFGTTIFHTHTHTNHKQLLNPGRQALNTWLISPMHARKKIFHTHKKKSQTFA